MHPYIHVLVYLHVYAGCICMYTCCICVHGCMFQSEGIYIYIYMQITYCNNCKAFCHSPPLAQAPIAAVYTTRSTAQPSSRIVLFRVYVCIQVSSVQCSNTIVCQRSQQSPQLAKSCFCAHAMLRYSNTAASDRLCGYYKRYALPDMLLVQ
jgi:hypothetical protein